MIKKPEELKKAFSSGSIPSQGDFSDLIDSFVPRDAMSPHAAISADDWDTLREMAVWWRSAAGSGTGVAPPAESADITIVAASVAAVELAEASKASVVAADGQWQLLPVINDKAGTWTCSAATINARPGFQVSGTAIAVFVSASPRLVQSMDPDTFFSWRTLQFEWKKCDDGIHFQLALRARRDFGSDTTGARASISCQIEFSPAIVPKVKE